MSEIEALIKRAEEIDNICVYVKLLSDILFLRLNPEKKIENTDKKLLDMISTLGFLLTAIKARNEHAVYTIIRSDIFNEKGIKECIRKSPSQSLEGSNLFKKSVLKVWELLHNKLKTLDNSYG